jgi:N-acylneuraminate cytidylyltransferase
MQRTAKKRRRGKKVIGFIPARGGSRGIPLKNIQMCGGYPLVAHSILALKAAGVTQVYVSTDHEKIAEISKRYGASVIDRPRRISTSISTTEEAIRHLLNNVTCDVIVMVQCTSPMLKAGDINGGMVKFFAGEYDSVFSVRKCNDTLLWDAKLKPMNYKPTHRSFRQARGVMCYVESGGFYIFTVPIFRKTGCRMGGKMGVYGVPFWQSFQIDDKIDLQMVDKLMKRKGDA